MTSCSSPRIARQARIRGSSVRRMSAPSSGWRRSNFSVTGRTPGAAFSIGTIAVSNTLAKGPAGADRGTFLLQRKAATLLDPVSGRVLMRPWRQLPLGYRSDGTSCRASFGDR